MKFESLKANNTVIDVVINKEILFIYIYIIALYRNKCEQRVLVIKTFFLYKVFIVRVIIIV